MPYDAEGNFIYPLPPRKGKADPANRPVKSRPNPARPTASPTPTLPGAKSSPPEPEAEQATPGHPPSPQPPESADPAPDARPVFTIQEGNNRWQMSEMDLAHLWNAQAWPAGLKLATSAGLPVEVIYRGRWSGGFGPDFKGGIVRVGPELLKGDIELHLQSSDWRLHGHHQNERFNNVVLQVTLEDNPSGASRNQTSAGQNIAVVALLPLFRQAGESLAAALANARASGTKLGSISESDGPCCDRVAERTSDLLAVLARLDGLGDRRFEQRAERYEAACAADPDATESAAAQQLWEGWLEALGYSQNKAAFVKLGATLTLAQVVELSREGWRQRESSEERVLTLEAALLGTAGLLPSQRRLKPSAGHGAGPGPEEPAEDFIAARYTAELESRWNWLRRHLAATASVVWQPLAEREWTFARLRPANHPARRIAGLARVIAGLELEEGAGLVERLAARLDLPEAEACRRLGEFFQAPLHEDESDSAAFWSRRYDFSDRAIMAGAGVHAAKVDLIGPDRAADIVVNVALPFLAGYSRDRRKPELTRRSLAIYRVHPRLAANELVENVARQVFRYWLEHPAEAPGHLGPGGRVSLPRLIEGARRQQGLIYLHHNFCASQDFTGCPLA